MLLAPGVGILAFVFAYGVFSLLDGVIATIGAFVGISGKRIDWRLLVSGLLGIVIGVIFLLRPALSITATSFLLAAWMIAIGVSTALSGIQHRKEIRGEWLLIIARSV